MTFPSKEKEAVKEYNRKYRQEHREEERIYHKQYRHKVGACNKYNSRTTGIKSSKRQHRQRYKYLKKNAGDLPVQRIQMVYEDNIKKYGTLTCYLCLKPIGFGNDHLEHKTPLSRGGTNEYENLSIACQKCNCKKNNKTVEEYKTNQSKGEV